MSASAQNPDFITDAIDNSPVTGQQLLVILMCLVFNMVDGFDITAMALVASSVGQELNLGADKLGWIFSFALAGMMVGAMFLAPISDTIGRRKMIIISLLLIGVSVLLTANANSLTEFVILRFISGLGAGALLASQAALAAEYSPERYRSLAIGVVTAGYPLGAMMTSVVAGQIMPEYGWRGMFWFGGGITVLMAVVAFLLLPESLKYLLERKPKNALAKINGILTKLKKATLTELPATSTSTNHHNNLRQNIKILLGPEHRRTTLLLWASFFLCLATLYVLLSWVPRLVQDSGYDFSTGREAFFWFNFGGVVGVFVMGSLATRYMLTSLLSLMLLASAVSMVIFAAVNAELFVMMIIIFIVGLLLQGGYTGLYAASAKAYPTAIRATGVGWCIGLGRSGAVIGPAIAGYLIAAQLSMASIFYIFALPMAIAGLICYLLKIK